MDSHSHPEIIQMQVQYLELAKKVEHHDKILVTGSDEQLSLPETVRSLASTVKSYIERKEKEEEDKKKEWNRWKWAILTPVIGGTVIFIAQAVIFFFRFMPIMTALANDL